MNTVPTVFPILTVRSLIATGNRQGPEPQSLNYIPQNQGRQGLEAPHPDHDYDNTRSLFNIF